MFLVVGIIIVIVAHHPKHTVSWVGTMTVVGREKQLGFREDGVVVWRDMTPPKTPKPVIAPTPSPELIKAPIKNTPTKTVKK